MLKRIVSAALALLFCFSVSGITNKVSAEEKEQFAAASVGDTSSNTETGYISYRQGIASDHYATENLIMDSPVETTGNVAEDGVQLTENGQYIVCSAYVSEDGWYQPSVYYQAIEDQGNSIEIAFQIDGEYPYSQLSSVLLNRAWVNAYEEFASDKKGNQYSPEQKETFIWQTSSFRDVNGFINDMLLVWLTKGEHKIKLILNSEKVKVGSVALESPEVIITDEEYRNLINSSGYKQYSGNEIVIEGENADLKSSRFLAPLANRNSAIVKPSDPYKKVINYIGGSNWKSVGDTLTWNFDVEEDGLYNIGFCFHQTYLQESVSYRTVRIDGKIPYESAKSVASLSQRSLYECPACPFTQTNFISCFSINFKSFSQRSGLRAGDLSAFFQPLSRHEYTHFFSIASIIYFESEYSVTSHLSLRAESAFIAAVSSILLFVVDRSPPESSFSVFP